MALGSTQPLTQMSMRNFPVGKGRLARKADNLTAICEMTVYKMWEPRRLTTLWASTACHKDSFIFLRHLIHNVEKYKFDFIIACNIETIW
jgi:hypothetical protein